MPAVHNAATGSRDQEKINVLPMIDILLVLLIIFMIRPPELRQDLHLPLPAPGAPETSTQIVLDVASDGYRVNDEPVPDTSLGGFLEAAFRHRRVKLLFIRAQPTVTYRDVIVAVDRARGAGVQLIAYMPSREVRPR